MTSPQPLLFTGAFHGGVCPAARKEVLARVDAGARDVLYVVASGRARRAVIGELVRGGSALFGTRVLTLDALPLELERRAHQVSPAALDPFAAQLLSERATRAACAGRLDEGASVAGLARQVSGVVADLERSGARPEVLRAALLHDEASRDESAVLLQSWEGMRALGAGVGRTPAEALADAVRLLRDHPDVLAGLDLLVLESPTLTHPLERELVEALIAATLGGVVAAVETPPSAGAGPAARTLSLLRSLARWDERRCERAGTPFDAALGRLFSPEPGAGERGRWAPEHGVQVRRVEAVGDVGEVRMAARIVARHLRDGVPPEEIAVVLRSPGRTPQLIAEVFGAAGIPVDLPTRRSAAESGIGDVLLRLLAAALDPERCTRGEALALLRAPHLALGERAGDRVEAAITRAGLLGFSSWSDLTPELVGEHAAHRIERVCRALDDAHARLRALATPEDAAAVVRRLARDLRLLGNAYFARIRVLREGGEDAALRRLVESAILEDNQAWEEIEEVLARMPALLALSGADPSAHGLALAAEWLALFRRALDDATLAPPARRCGAVRVVPAAAAGERPARVVLVLGLLEKVFPRQVRQDAFLRDDTRARLRAEYGWHLPLSEELAEGERELFLRAISLTTETLYLSCAAVNAAGGAALPSFFLEDLQRALPYTMAIDRERVSDVTPTPADAAGSAELMASLAHDVWQRLPGTASAERRRTEAYAVHDVWIERHGRAAPLTGSRAPEARPAFDPALFEGAPHRTLVLSASQLKALGHCTYAHYVDKVLRPDTLEAPAYDALGRGSLLHDAIMAFATQFGGWHGAPEAIERTDGWMADRVRAWAPALAGDPAARHGAEVARRRLREFLATEVQGARLARELGGALPRYHELAFGEQADSAGPRDPASVETPLELDFAVAHGTVTTRFRGSIDRVDVFEVGGRRYGVAIDYKTGKTASYYGKDMMRGYDLQLRLYLAALREFWGITPIGALYVGFGDGVRHGAVHADFASRIPGLGSSVKQLSAGEWEDFAFAGTRQAIAPLIERLVALDITARPRDFDCGFCTHRPLCRFTRHSVEASVG